MPEGERLWTAPLPDGTRQAVVREAAHGLVLVDADGAALALDAAAGTVRWRARGHVLGWATGGVTGRATVVTFDAADARGIVHAGVRADTGERVWEDVLAADEQYGIDHRAVPSPVTNRPEVGALVVVRRSDGTTRVRDAASGALWRGRVHPLVQSPVVVIDDLLLVSYPIGARGEIAAYDLADLKHRWTVPGGFSQATGCGPVVCLTARSLSAIDPTTGRERWRQAGASVAWPAVPGAPAGPLLGYRDGGPDGDHGGEPVVLRADTGALIMRLNPWRVLGSDGSRLLLLRPGEGAASQSQGDGAGAAASDLLGLADLEAGTVRVLGALPAVAPACPERDTTRPGCPLPFGRPGQCLPGSGWAVCGHTDGQVRVWRFTAG
jgi:outer membrane protein assembly factor BamB